MAPDTSTATAAVRHADDGGHRPLKVLRLPQVTERIGLGRTAIYRRLDKEEPEYDPTFPRPISLGKKSIGFIEAEVDAWLESRLLDRRGPRQPEPLAA